MPLTQIDTHCALIVIDLQQGIVAYPTVHPSSEIVARSAQLACAFRAKGLPVVLVNVDGLSPGRTDSGPTKMSFPPGWTDFVAELEPHPSDHIVTKQRRGAFLGTDLHAYLTRHGVTQVVLVGISTSAGVESTARSAYDLGYHVALVIDAMTDMDADNHRHCVEKIFPRMGETAKTADVLTLLSGRSA